MCCFAVAQKVGAIIVYDKSQDEANRFFHRNESNDSRQDKLAQDEDVFVSMLHRRARLLNRPFQAKVLAVLQERQAPEGTRGGYFEADSEGATMDASHVQFVATESSPHYRSKFALQLDPPPLVGDVGVVPLSTTHYGGSMTSAPSDRGTSASCADPNALGRGDHDLFLPVVMSASSPDALTYAELDSLPEPCTPEPGGAGLEPLPIARTQWLAGAQRYPPLIARTQSTHFRLDDLVVPDPTSSMARTYSHTSVTCGEREPHTWSNSATYVELLCNFRTGVSPVLANSAPIKTKQRMGEKLAEYAADGFSWPLTACILDPVRVSLVCKGPSQMLEVIAWFTEHQSATGLRVCRVKNKFSFTREEVLLSRSLARSLGCAA